MFPLTLNLLNLAKRIKSIKSILLSALENCQNETFSILAPIRPRVLLCAVEHAAYPAKNKPRHVANVAGALNYSDTIHIGLFDSSLGQSGVA